MPCCDICGINNLMSLLLVAFGILLVVNAQVKAGVEIILLGVAFSGFVYLYRNRKKKETEGEYKETAETSDLMCC